LFCGSLFGRASGGAPAIATVNGAVVPTAFERVFAWRWAASFIGDRQSGGAVEATGVAMHAADLLALVGGQTQGTGLAPLLQG
jgi:hypothetical protein